MMKKAESVKEFVERVDQAKKKNPKDLSSDQDLTIAIMNLISIENHLPYNKSQPCLHMLTKIRLSKKS